MKKILVGACLILLACVLVFSGCSSHGKTMIKAGKTDVSVNVYMLYLSRMKGDLGRAGMAVTSADFWATYASVDNTTYADHYTAQVLSGLREIAAALMLYEELGLTLPRETKEDINAWIDQIVKDSGEGKKNKANSLLSAYGANLTTLRDAAEIEAKVAQLKAHLYGQNGELISATAKEEFYRATYYRGYQMLIANTYYDHDKDADGRTIYYVKNDKGLAGAKIAYDTENGSATTEKDKNGDTVYRDENTLIAYDSENGVPNYRYDAKGERVIVQYTEEEMRARLTVAEKIATECKGDTDKFLQYAAAYSDNSDFTTSFAPNGLYFSTIAYVTDSIFGKFAQELVKLEAGEIALLQSDSGYYLLQRAPLDNEAWNNEANRQWFSTFGELIVEYMLQQRTKEYVEQIVVDEALAASVKITDVEPNYYY